MPNPVPTLALHDNSSYSDQSSPKKKGTKDSAEKIGPRSPIVYLTAKTKRVIDDLIATHQLTEGVRLSSDAIVSKALEEYILNHHNHLYIKHFKQ